MGPLRVADGGRHDFRFPPPDLLEDVQDEDRELFGVEAGQLLPALVAGRA